MTSTDILYQRQHHPLPQNQQQTHCDQWMLLTNEAQADVESLVGGRGGGEPAWIKQFIKINMNSTKCSCFCCSHLNFNFHCKSAPNHPGKHFDPPSIKQIAHLNWGTSSLKKCPKPSWQAFRPPPLTGNAQIEA